jgi:hypothetical protein
MSNRENVKELLTAGVGRVTVASDVDGIDVTKSNEEEELEVCAPDLVRKSSVQLADVTV